MTGRPADIEEIENCFDEIAGCVEQRISSLYITTCKRCGQEARILAAIWNRDENQVTELRYACARCKKRSSKKPDTEDLRLLQKVEKLPIKDWYPKDKFPDGITFAQGKREAGEYFSDLFTHRNLLSLSILWNEIAGIKDKALRETFSFTFTSMVHLASKMTPVRPSRPFSSFWAINSYWVPPLYMESNVWMLFQSAAKGRQGLIAAKEDANESITQWKPAKRFSDLTKGANIFLKVHNALELSKILPENSVDYVFTDPPYGGAVPYAELTTLWALWLGFKIDYDDEITIDNRKNFEYYHKMLQAAFRQVFRVLRNGRYLTVTFHSTDIKVWNSIIRAVVLAGFDLEKIIYQPPARASAKGLLVPYGSAVGDYYIRFKKPETAHPVESMDISEDQYEHAVVEAAKKILAERGEPTAYTYILNGIIVELKKAGALLAAGKNPDKVMRAHIDREFVLQPAVDEKGKTVGQRWWFADPSSIPYLEQIPLTDRLETAVVDVLHRNVKVSFDDVLQQIFLKFPNALTPETQRVGDLLEEYATQTSDGHWALKPIVHTRESEHTKIISILAELGKKAGLHVAIGAREQGEVYAGKKLAALASKTPPNLAKVPQANVDRIRQIDVLWHNGRSITAAFEVENTTAITEAIVRCSNIPSHSVKRFIVLPEERERLLHRKLREPMIADRMKDEEWDFVFYGDLDDLYRHFEHKKTFAMNDLLAISREPTARNRNQMEMDFS